VTYLLSAFAVTAQASRCQTAGLVFLTEQMAATTVCYSITFKSVPDNDAKINDPARQTGARDTHPRWAKEINMLWTIFVLLLILWLLGFSLHVAGGLIHLLLVVALVVLVINLVSGRRVA
jgi:apolipoprotein N-acyltransferase